MKKNEDGVALIVVLWIAILFSTIALSLAYITRLQMRLSSYERDEVLCLNIARAGVEHAIARLINDEGKGYDTKSEWILGKDEGESFRLGDGSYRVRCVDEEGKLNINLEGEASLKVLPRMDEGIIDAILDWRDKDSLHRLNGAEDEYYQGLRHPYHCKDGPFDTVEELLLVKGMTGDLLYGEDVNQNGDLDRGEDKDEDGQVDSGLIDFLTVFGDGKININTAAREVIEAALGIGPTRAQEIVSHREETPFKDPAEILELEGIEGLPRPTRDRIMGKVRVDSSIFTITSTAVLVDRRTTRRIKAVVNRDFSPIRVVYWRED